MGTLLMKYKFTYILFKKKKGSQIKQNNKRHNNDFSFAFAKYKNT